MSQNTENQNALTFDTDKKKPIMARESLGLNQSTMAAAMGVHRNTWGKWERDE
jgi:DNA-binding XRE family transcriptional regulator